MTLLAIIVLGSMCAWFIYNFYRQHASNRDSELESRRNALEVKIKIDENPLVNSVFINFQKKKFEIYISENTATNFMNDPNTHEQLRKFIVDMQHFARKIAVRDYKFALINQKTNKFVFESQDSGDTHDKTYGKFDDHVNSNFHDKLTITRPFRNETIKDRILIYHNNSISIERFDTEQYFVSAVYFTPNISTESSTKGRVGSALVGGVIAGPVGAAVGASRKQKIVTKSTEETAPIKLVLRRMKDGFNSSIIIYGNTELATQLNSLVK